MNEKQTILFLLANPVDTERARLDEELREVKESLRLAANRDQLVLEQAFAVRIEDLRRAMLNYSPTIVHFAGFGETNGIFLQDSAGQKVPVRPEVLRDFFANFSSVQCVVFNACYSEEVAATVAQRIPYVIGMQAVAKGRWSITFAASFYDGIGAGVTYESAFKIAYNALDFDGTLETVLPVFNVRRPTGTENQSSEQTALQGATPGQQVQTDITAELGFEWIPISAGKFTMGSGEIRDKDRCPIHEVDFLGEYRIARFPVTVAQFRHFITATDHQTTAKLKFEQDTGQEEQTGLAHDWNGTAWLPTPGAYWEQPHGPNSYAPDNHPVTCISWHDAMAFCEWLSNASGQSVRLPTEAEWEKAARGTDMRIWPWGNEPPTEDRCNFGKRVMTTTPVDRYSLGVSPYGVWDMAGNVWEWTSSLDLRYPITENDGRDNSQAGGLRILRGGSFFQETRNVRCAYRHSHGPDATVSDIGFRVVASGSDH